MASLRTESSGSPWSHNSTTTLSRPKHDTRSVSAWAAALGPSFISAAGTRDLRHPVSTTQLSLGQLAQPRLLVGGMALLAAGEVRLADRAGQRRVARRVAGQRRGGGWRAGRPRTDFGRTGAGFELGHTRRAQAEFGPEHRGQTERAGRFGETAPRRRTRRDRSRPALRGRAALLPRRVPRAARPRRETRSSSDSAARRTAWSTGDGSAPAARRISSRWFDHAGLSPPSAPAGRSVSRRCNALHDIAGLLNATVRLYRTLVRPRQKCSPHRLFPGSGQWVTETRKKSGGSSGVASRNGVDRRRGCPGTRPGRRARRRARSGIGAALHRTRRAAHRAVRRGRRSRPHHRLVDHRERARRDPAQAQAPRHLAPARRPRRRQARHRRRPRCASRARKPDSP